MKRIAVSVGLVALGASFVQAADDPYPSAEAGKIWSASATLRGFYDDNVNTVPNGVAGRTSTAGFSISPGGNVNWQNDVNTLVLSYQYTFLYYDKRPSGNVQNYDQNHNFTGSFNHVFNERYRFKLWDSFVVGQEPDSLRSGDALTSTQRIPGDNTRNSGSIIFGADLTPIFGLEATYNNAFFNYANHGATIIPNPILPGILAPTVIPSNAGRLNRIEQTFSLDGRWIVNPETTALLGYKYFQGDYTGDELIAVDQNTGVSYYSRSRDLRQHTVDTGLEHFFTPDFFVSGRVGVSFTDYPHDPNGKSDTSPYVNLTANYVYGPESYIQGGFSYDRNATITTGSVSPTQGVTLGEETALVFAAINHRVVPHLTATLSASYQYSTDIGGYTDGQNNNYFIAGLNLRYQFVRYLSAEVGYDYDYIQSASIGTFDRNRVYIGISGTY